MWTVQKYQNKTIILLILWFLGKYFIWIDRKTVLWIIVSIISVPKDIFDIPRFLLSNLIYLRYYPVWKKQEADFDEVAAAKVGFETQRSLCCSLWKKKKNVLLRASAKYAH